MAHRWDAPPTWRETTPSNVGSAGINHASSVSCLITIWLGPRPRDCPKSFSTCLAFRAPVRIAFAGSSGRVLVGGGAAGSFARRHGRHGSGRRGGRLRVREEPNVLVLGEGSAGRMR